MVFVMSLFNPLEKRSSVSAMSAFIQHNGTLISNKPISAREALSNSDLYSVISLISSDIAGADFIGTSDALSVLNEPIPHLNSRYNFWQTVIVDLLLNGNAFVEIERKNGAPVGLRHIPIACVSVDLTGDKLSYDVSSFDDFDTTTISSDDMLHFKIMAYGEFDGLRGIMGHSPLESLVNEVNQQNQANRLALSTLKSAINPTSLIKIPEGILSREAKDKVREEFEKSNTGDNAGRVLVVDQGADFQTVSINSDVAKFLKNLDWSKTQVAKVFGVPDSYLNGSGDAQSSIKMQAELYAAGLNRYIEPIKSELARKFSGEIRLDMSDIMDYSKSAYKADVLAWVDAGIISAEEARGLLTGKGVM